jgi:signal transduction histidine kinase
MKAALKKLSILHLEDIPSDAEFIARALKKSGIDFEIKLVDTKDDFKDAITNFRPDVILSDHNLVEFTSTDAFAIFKSFDLEIPFILVTGTVSEEFAVSMMKEGINDYILKSNLSRLEPAIRHALKEKRTEKEKKVATEKLHQKNSELSTLIYRCSHDLRAPLMSLLGLLHLTKNEKTVDGLMKNMNLMEESVGKLDAILKGFSEYAIIMRKEVLDNKISFEMLIAEVMQRFKDMNVTDQVKFTIDVSQKKDFIGDDYALRVIFYNLIYNAIKYRKTNIESFVKVKVNGSEDMLCIEVSDNGIGINENMQQNIFDMFYRGENTNAGVGLGLYVVKNAIEKMNGTIAMKSQVGVGTTFYIELPYAFTSAFN